MTRWLNSAGMNHRLDHTVAVVRHEIECVLASGEREVVGHKLIDMSGAAYDQVDRRLRTAVLPAHVADGEFLASQGVDREADAVNLRNADDEQHSSRPENLQRLVERLLLAGAFKHEVDAQWLKLIDRDDDVSRSRTAGPSCPAAA